MASSSRCYFLCISLVLCAPSLLSGLLVTGEQAALVEVFLEERRDVNTVLQGEVVEATWGSISDNDEEKLHDLILVSAAVFNVFLN